MSRDRLEEGGKSTGFAALFKMRVVGYPGYLMLTLEVFE